MSDVTTIEADVPERYADAVATRLQKAADEDVVSRGTLSAPEGTPELTNRRGRLDIAEQGSPGLDEGSLSELTAGLKPPHYVAIMSYLPYEAQPAVRITLGDIDAIKESI